MPGATKSAAKPKVLKFSVDLSAPVKDKIIDVADYAKYLNDHIKVNNKLNNLGESVAVSREGAKVTVTSSIPMAKRYVKYLTKRYLKKHNVRDYLRVLASTKTAYELRYFKVEGQEDEE